MEVVLDDAGHDSRVAETFARYFEKEDYLDVTFVCKGGRQIRAHKLILSSVSPFLKQIFSEWKGNEDMVTISVPDVDHNILKLLLDFIYEGTTRLSQTELDGFKTVKRMLKIRLCGAVVQQYQVQQLPRSQPPPLLELRNKIHSGTQMKPVPQNIEQRQETETAAIGNGSSVPKINTTQPSNPVDEPLTPVRRSRNQDDPLNLPDYHFEPTTSRRSTFQTDRANINDNGGIVSSEGERHRYPDTASSSSPMSQQETGTVNNDQGAHSIILKQQSGSSVRKRPCTRIASDAEHFVHVSSVVNLEQTKDKHIGNKSKGVGLTGHSANTIIDTETTEFRKTKSRKTKL